MKFNLYFFTLLTGLLLSGCSNCDVTKDEKKLEKQTHGINYFAKEKFNSKFKILNNGSGNFAIVIKSIEDAKSPVINKQSFFVFDYNSNEILFEDEIVNANVYWETDNLVTVSRIPGIIKKDSESKLGNKVYTFDVVKKKKN